MTKSEAIRDYCLDCMGGQKGEVKTCPLKKKCSLWHYRMGQEVEVGRKNRLDRGKAIKENCLNCVCGVKSEINRCHIENCPLHSFRNG